eukprot:COSAG02_NODE_800_length_17049_cov_14.510737_2_plen_82_part_00
MSYLTCAPVATLGRGLTPRGSARAAKACPLYRRFEGIRQRAGASGVWRAFARVARTKGTGRRRAPLVACALPQLTAAERQQ